MWEGELKINLCNEVIRTMDFAGQCRFARQTGYDGLELAPFTLARDPSAMTTAELAELRRIADGEGVEISGLHWLLAAPDGLSITTMDRDTLEKTIAFGTQLTAMCAELGGRYLVHGSPAQRTVLPGNEEHGCDSALAYFDAVGDAATKNGVTYIIEPLSRADTGYLNTPTQVRSVIGQLSYTSLATMIDCYAAANDGHDPASLIAEEIAKGGIVHIHFNDDNKRGPGQGKTDFAAVIGILKSLGYSHDAAVEPFDYHPDGPLCAARAIGYLRGLLDMNVTDGM